MRQMITVLLWVVGAYVALIGLMYVAQKWLLFQPMPLMVSTPDEYGLNYEDVELDTEDGESIHAWWIPSEEDRGTLLFFHGNAGNISGRVPSIRQFNDLGLNVLIVSYRGYGESSGSPSEAGLYLDAKAAYEHLVEDRGINPNRIVSFGRSLGSGVATWVAHEYETGALMIESPFTSVPELARHVYPWIPTRRLVRPQFDNKARIADINTPLLVLHSPDDAIVPFELGEALYEAANGPKELFRMRGGHNDGFTVSEPEYSQSIDHFLSRNGFPRQRD